MSAQILSGKEIGQSIRDRLKGEVDEILETGAPKPRLAVVLIGDDPASHVYVRNKQRACEKAGIDTEDERPSADISPDALIALGANLLRARMSSGVWGRARRPLASEGVPASHNPCGGRNRMMGTMRPAPP